MHARSQELSACPPLVGRATELGVLEEQLATVDAERGRCVLLQGEAGIGKTALLEAFAAQCRRSGVPVVDGAVGQGGPLDLCGTGQVPPAWARLCAQGPAVVLLDGERPAAAGGALLSRMERTAEQLPLLVCGTVRAGDGRSGSERALSVSGGGGNVLTVSPLAAPDVAALAGLLLGMPPGPRLLEQLSAAGGNPRLVTALLSDLTRADGGLPAANGCVPAGAVRNGANAPAGFEGPPGAVADAVARQLEGLPGETRRTLGQAALMGSCVPLWELALVLDRPVMEVWECLAPAMEAGVLGDSRDGLVFRHELVREMLANGAKPGEKEAFHRGAGQALAVAGAAPETVAQHLLQGDGPLDPSALNWVAGQAPALGRRAPATAARLLERALASVGTEAPGASAFRRELACALLRSGEPDRAAGLARTVLASGCLPGERADLRLLLVRCAWLRGDYGEALGQAVDGLQESPGDGRIEGAAAQCHAALGRFDAAETAARRAMAAGGEGGAAAQGLTVQAWHRLSTSCADEAVRLADEAIARLGGYSVEDGLLVSPYLVRGLALMDLGRFDEARAALDRVLPDAGPGGLSAWCRAGRAGLGFLQGRWDEALTEAVEGRTADRALWGLTALVAVHRSTVPADPGPSDGSDGTGPASFVLPWARALVQEAQGEVAQALAMLCRLWRSGAPGPGRWVLYGVAVDAVRLADAAGDADALRAVTAKLAAETVGEAPAGVRGAALLGQGLLEEDTGVLADAANVFRAAGLVLFEAYAVEGTARVLTRQGEVSAARRASHRAAELYGRLGAVWDAERADGALAGAGVRARRPSGTRPCTGWDSLTAVELRIVEHVAEGRSNPDIGAQMFLSPRTVQFHLSAVFAKLGVGSRVELAVEAHRRGSV